MSGINAALDVYLGAELIAHFVLVNEQLNWNYSEKWSQSGYAISPHLPLSGSIPSVNVHRFLKNLLPEGNALEELIASFHVSRNNIFALIQASIGLD